MQQENILIRNKTKRKRKKKIKIKYLCKILASKLDYIHKSHSNNKIKINNHSLNNNNQDLTCKRLQKFKILDPVHQKMLIITSELIIKTKKIYNSNQAAIFE